MATQTFFTADTHFGHSAILKFCERPFTTIEDMNEALIANWNAVVREEDVVYHLGDFAYKSATHPKKITDRLNGTIHLISGNHDEATITQNAKAFASISLMQEITVEGQKIVLFHFPMREWPRAWHGAWQLFGHVHGNLDFQPYPKSLDVGVDSHNYFPVSFEQLKTLMTELPEFRHTFGEGSRE